MCLPGAERVILSASEGPPQCPSFPCGLKFFSPPSIFPPDIFRESALTRASRIMVFALHHVNANGSSSAPTVHLTVTRSIGSGVHPLSFCHLGLTPYTMSH